jgi:uptake hydrogenase large subunit
MRHNTLRRPSALARLGDGRTRTPEQAAEAVAALRGAALPPAGWVRAGPPGVRCGYAAVETSRGRLHYRLMLDGNGNLAEAQVLAPTEWNLHPTGPAVCDLRGQPLGPDPRAELTRRIAAVDPCVGFLVELADA